MINLTERLRQGRENRTKDRAGEEVKKLGVLRAGMSGIRSSETGDIAGTCHRKTHLRALGIEIETPDEHKQMMFEMGYASEDITYDLLEKSLLPGEIMLREEQIPIQWQLPNGTKVSGRPDIVICKQLPEQTMINNGVASNFTVAPIPILGLELKSVHSMWTARDVLFNGQPKMNNLIQAAHYMWKLGVPYKLVYKGYSALGQSMNDWAAKLFPKKGEPLSQYIDYNEKGGIKGIKQFEVVYDMMIDDRDRVCYKLESATEWVRTIITTADIEKYYSFVAEMPVSKDLGPRPMTIDAHGDKLNYKDCQYCPLQSTCDMHEDAGYDEWLKQVREKCK